MIEGSHNKERAPFVFYDLRFLVGKNILQLIGIRFPFDVCDKIVTSRRVIITKGPDMKIMKKPEVILGDGSFPTDWKAWGTLLRK